MTVCAVTICPNPLDDCAASAVGGVPTARATELSEPHHASIVGMCSLHNGPACPPVSGVSGVTESGALTAFAMATAAGAPPTASSWAAIA